MPPGGVGLKNGSLDCRPLTFYLDPASTPAASVYVDFVPRSFANEGLKALQRWRSGRSGLEVSAGRLIVSFISRTKNRSVRHLVGLSVGLMLTALLLGWRAWRMTGR